MRLASATAVLGLVVSVALPGSASAQIVETYEAFGSCDNNSTIGLFNGINYENEFICYNDVQFPYNPNSGIARLRWNVGGPTTEAFFSFAAPTTFQGAFFAGAGPSVYFELFLNNVLVSTSGILNSSSTPTFLATNYLGMVDRIRVIGDGDQIILDDLTWGGPSGTVPEPATMTLMAIGLGSMAAARRRRKP